VLMLAVSLTWHVWLTSAVLAPRRLALDAFLNDSAVGVLGRIRANVAGTYTS
jgi:hypothetical protein